MDEMRLSEPSAQLGAPALRAFFTIAERWRLNELQQALLLGIDDLQTLRKWKSQSQAHETVSLPESTLERLGYVFGIFKAINILLPLPHRADRWMRSPNTAPIFGGRSAIERITAGTVRDLLVVHQYLLSQVDDSLPSDAVPCSSEVSPRDG